MDTGRDDTRRPADSRPPVRPPSVGTFERVVHRDGETKRFVISGQELRQSGLLRESGSVSESVRLDRTEIQSGVFRRPQLKVDVHSEEVQEILGYIPHWIVRWGITVFAVILLLILTGTWLIRYPDVVVGNIEITSVPPPAEVQVRMNGTIDRLLVDDRDVVQEGQYLAVLAHTANYLDILALRTRLDECREKLSSTGPVGCESGTFAHDWDLGPVEQEYEDFVSSLEACHEFRNIDYYRKKITALEEQVRLAGSRLEQLLTQERLAVEETDLIEQRFQRASALFETGGATAADLENARNELLRQKYSLVSAGLSITDARLQISKDRQSIVELRDEEQKQDKRLNDAVNHAAERLSNAIKDWERQYVLTAPLSGRVSLSDFWSDNRNVSTGETVFTVVPDGCANMVGCIMLPVDGSGKVVPNQRVNIKLSNYPSEEFGVVQGIIRSKSLLPSAGHYTVIVDFPVGLTTTHGVELEFSHNMTGAAEIVTDDLTLLTRIMNRARSYLDE